MGRKTDGTVLGTPDREPYRRVDDLGRVFDPRFPELRAPCANLHDHRGDTAKLLREVLVNSDFNSIEQVRPHLLSFDYGQIVEHLDGKGLPPTNFINNLVDACSRSRDTAKDKKNEIVRTRNRRAAELLRELVDESGLAQARVAARLGKNKESQVSEFLTGSRVPPAPTAAEMARACLGQEAPQDAIDKRVKAIKQAAHPDRRDDAPQIPEQRPRRGAAHPADTPLRRGRRWQPRAGSTPPPGSTPPGSTLPGSTPPGSTPPPSSTPPSSTPPSSAVPPSTDTRGRPRRRLLWSLAAALVVLVIVAAVLVAVGGSSRCDGGPDGTVKTDDGQCIGLSDGSYNLITGDPKRFGDMFSKINQANADATRGAPPGGVVTVAYVIPFTGMNDEQAAAASDDRSPQLSDQFLRELQGAYVWQRQANGSTSALKGSPRIKLDIVNIGLRGEHADAAVDQLLQTTQNDEAAPLVAAVGFEQSYPGVNEAVNKLGEAGIPMVGARIVDDTIADKAGKPFFFGTGSPVKAQVAAVKQLVSTSSSGPIMLLRDTNPADLYGRGVADQFKSSVVDGGRPIDPGYDIEFDSSRNGTEAKFKAATDSICAKRPSSVFFAGRGYDLQTLVRQLGVRGCPLFRVNIVSLSDGRLLANALRTEAARGGNNLKTAMDFEAGVNVEVAALATPQDWAANPGNLFAPGTHNWLDGSDPTYFPQLFPGQDVTRDDPGGDVIMGSDAMLVALTSIRGGADQQSDEAVTPASVLRGLNKITRDAPVRAASGPIGYAGPGYPVDKYIPITQVRSDGSITLVPGTY